MTTEVQGEREWHNLDRGELERALDTGPHGLSQAAVEARLLRHGPNQLKEPPPPSPLVMLLHQLQNPIIYLLLVANVITLALADYVDAAVIAAAVALNTIIGFTQERSAERSVRALMRLLVPRAHVIRDGREAEIESRTLVPGDLVLLESGTRVPADIRLISATMLAVDESLLTGESVPVVKHHSPLGVALQVADRTNTVFAGTAVTRGRGRGYVIATGTNTVLGAIAEQIRAEERPETPLQNRMKRFSHVITVTVIVSAALVLGIGTLLRMNPADVFMVAVAMAVAAVPEGLPVAFTVTLAVGVRRMARRQAIIRRLAAIETLGSTTVIGSDKTGTLTENRMTVQKIWAGGEWFSLTGDLWHEREYSAVDLAEHRPLRLTLLAGVLANEAEIYPRGDGFETRGDPTETALLIAAERMGMNHREARELYASFAEVPFEPERQYSASVRLRDGKHCIFVKGAPERVVGMCHHCLQGDKVEELRSSQVLDAARTMAARGLRVLGMAHAELPDVLENAVDVPEPEALTFLGLVGMMDPPRPGVHDAIAGCQEAGVRVVMITGDHAATAGAIAADLGIAKAGEPVVTGEQLAAMDERTLRERVLRTSVYARAAPEQKLQVVRAFQAHGEVVAVTGDGVNDAPALKAAEVGIAMGKSGTDVAREASDMVLADDNFVSIFGALEEGRITFDNLRKVTFFLISTGVGAILAVLAALALQWPLPFVPAQLLWLNIVTSGLQDMALAFEPGEPGVLKRAPRDPREGILSALLWERVVVSGMVMAVGSLLLFRWELERTQSLAAAQTVALTTMVLFQFFQVGNSRSERTSIFRISPVSNRFLFVVTATALIVHTSALYWPATQYVLRVAPVGLDAWLRMGAVATSIIVVVELHKLLRRAAYEGGSKRQERGP